MTMEIKGTNDNVFLTVNNVKFGHAVNIEFNNWREVSDWWSANPTAIRQWPESNDKIKAFPTRMTFMFHVKNDENSNS